MLMFIYNKKEDVIKAVQNGQMQSGIYDYLKELEKDNLLYPQAKNDLTKDTICEFFEAEIDGKYISDEQIQNPNNAIELLLNNIILAVYDRWKTEIS